MGVAALQTLCYRIFTKNSGQMGANLLVVGEDGNKCGKVLYL